MLFEQPRLAGDLKQPVMRRPPAVADAGEHMLAQGVVLDQPGIMTGDSHVRFGEHLLHIGKARGEQRPPRSEEHTSELQSLMRISYAVFCLKKKKMIIYSVTHHIITNR